MTYNFYDYFGVTYPEECPMSCKISDAGRCGEDVFSHSSLIEQLEPLDELTWALRGSTNQFYDLLVCLTCETEYMASSIDNWAIGVNFICLIFVSDDFNLV